MKTTPFIRFISLLAFVLFASAACTSTTSNQGSQPITGSSKLLVISSVSTNFELQLGTSSKTVVLNNDQINPLVLDAATKAFNGRFSVVGTQWQSNLPDPESTGSTWKRATLGSFTQGLVGNSKTMDANVLRQIQQINSEYHADFIVLIYGRPRLTSALITSNTGPVQILMDMYLVKANSDEILAFQDGNVAEKPYSAEANAKLYDSLQNKSGIAQHKPILIQWINTQAPRLANEIASQLVRKIR